MNSENYEVKKKAIEFDMLKDQFIFFYNFKISCFLVRNISVLDKKYIAIIVIIFIYRLMIKLTTWDQLGLGY